MNKQFKIPMSKPDFSKEEEESLIRVFKSNWPSQGKITEEFEYLLSDYLNSNAVVVNNGSSALMCALLAHGIKPGDKVIVPAFTFIASSSIPKILGAEIIVADIDPGTLNTTPEIVEDLLKKHNVRFVIVVDVAGLPTDIDSFTELAKKYNFILIEDAAQAFGSEYKNKKIGAFSHLTIFSFQIAKQITTIEGGCIGTTNESIIKKINQIKDYGRNKNEMYVHDIIGSNFRTTDLQSAIGIQQLKRAQKHIERRNNIAEQYKKKINQVNFQKIPPFVSKHSYMLFFALANNKEERNNYTKYCSNNGIDVRKSWTPIHMQPCNLELKKCKCPNSEKVFENSFTLPIFNSMTLDEANIVIEAIREFNK